MAQRAPTIAEPIAGPNDRDVRLRAGHTNATDLAEASRWIAARLAEGKDVLLAVNDQTLTTTQAARQLDVPRNNLLKLIRQGAIPATKTHRGYRIHQDDVQRYRQQLRTERQQSLAALMRYEIEHGYWDEDWSDFVAEQTR